MGSWWLSSHWSGDRVISDLQHATLVLTWSEERSDRPDPINQLVMLSPSTYMFYPDYTFKSALVANSQTYLLGARRRWMKVNCVERIGICPVLRTWNWQQLENLPSAWVYWLCIPASTKANGFPPWYIPNTIWILWWVVKHRTKEKYIACIPSSNKKTKQNLQGIRLGK